MYIYNVYVLYILYFIICICIIYILHILYYSLYYCNIIYDVKKIMSGNNFGFIDFFSLMFPWLNLFEALMISYFTRYTSLQFHLSKQ